jgi:hypothetical protein
VRAGAQTAAELYTAEERDALGISSLIIATSGTSPLIYLAEELTKRSDRLRAHGKFVNTLPACAIAAALMRHLDAIPGSSRSAAKAAPAPVASQQAVITRRYSAGAAASAGIGGRHIPRAAAVAVNAGGGFAGVQGVANAGKKSLGVPLDGIDPLALAHQVEVLRFIEYASFREMPAAAGDPLEEIITKSSRTPRLAALIPSALDRPAWAPARPQPIETPKMIASRIHRTGAPMPASHPAHQGRLDTRRANTGDSSQFKAQPVVASGGTAAGIKTPVGSTKMPEMSLEECVDLYADLVSLHAKPAEGKKRKVQRTRISCMHPSCHVQCIRINKFSFCYHTYNYSSPSFKL